jgi:hypothetical protein
MRQPVFEEKHRRLIAEVISARMDELPDPNPEGITRGDLIEASSMLIDAIEGLFTADDPSFDWITWQDKALSVSIGPTSNRSIYRGRRVLAINGIGE